jgi:hypothetical protein
MWSKNRSSSLRPLKNKGFKEEIVTKIGVYDILKSTPLESNNPTTSLSCADQICPRRIAAFWAQATKGSGVLRPRKPLC